MRGSRRRSRSGRKRWRTWVFALALPREVPKAFSDNDLGRLPTAYWLDPLPRVSGAVTNAPTALPSPTEGTGEQGHRRSGAAAQCMMTARSVGARRTRTKRTPVDERTKAYKAYDKRLRNAWKTSASDTIPKTGDRWTDAMVAAGTDVDIEPLANYLNDVAAEREPALAHQQLGNLASLLRLLHARSQKRKRGKPGGTLWRWSDPNYLAAWIVEQRIAAWRRDHARNNIPDSKRAEIIARTVDEARTWHCAKRKPPSVDRVTAILNGPRSRRLPGC